MKVVEGDLFKPVTPKRTFEDISDQIKELIYTKALKPMDKLPSERDLAVRFNAGRMAVREALRILEEGGFISVKQGGDGGIFVKELDSTGVTKSLADLIKIGNISLHEITESRIAIESMILELEIGNLSKRDLKKLESNIRQSEKRLEQIEKGTLIRIPEEIVNFHVLLAEVSKNQIFKYFHSSLVDLTYLYIRKFAPELTLSPHHLDQHKDIYNAVKQKDLKGAKKALQDHLYSVGENITKAMKSSDNVY